MAPQPRTRQRLLQAALQLFAAQGITETTTRQIAELAGVNEVTLFRQFGSKYGLLLAVIEEAAVFDRLDEILSRQAAEMDDPAQAVTAYGVDSLRLLSQYPQLVRSIIGEAGQYPPENRRALGRRFAQVNQQTARYLAAVLSDRPLRLPIEQVASLLNALLLGYTVIEFSSAEGGQNQEAFLRAIVQLFLRGALADAPPPAAVPDLFVADLPARTVRSILLTARKASPQDYALAYVLFGAGLSAEEIAGLERAHVLPESQQTRLYVRTGTPRQVPLFNWIMGFRYGSGDRNPLTRWLKHRKDSESALFLDEQGSPISAATIADRWQTWTATERSPTGAPLTIEQAQHTWRVEQLTKGLSLENLSILTGESSDRLQPFVRRAKAIAALEQASRLDQRQPSGATD